MALLTIVPILAGNSHVFLIPNGTHSVLVDAGVPGSHRRVLAAARRAGVAPSDIALIILTHAHFDHAGGLHALQAETGAQVIAGAAEAPGLRAGSTPMPAGTTRLSKALVRAGGRFASRIRFHPVQPDIVMDSRRDLADFSLPGYLLPTPGHTAGSISLVLEERAALCGDALFGIFRSTAYPPFANDPARLLESWEALLATPCQVFYPAHGRPVSRNLLEKSLREQQR